MTGILMRTGRARDAIHRTGHPGHCLQDGTIYKPRREASEEIISPDTLILDFQLPEL